MLLKKTIFELSCVNEFTVEGLIEYLDCTFTSVGRHLYDCDQVRKELPENDSPIKDDCLTVYLTNNGTDICLNSNQILFETVVNLDKPDNNTKRAVMTMAMAYMNCELGKIVESRTKEYVNFIGKCFKNNFIGSINFKIFELCGKQYFCIDFTES